MLLCSVSLIEAESKLCWRHETKNRAPSLHLSPYIRKMLFAFRSTSEGRMRQATSMTMMVKSLHAHKPAVCGSEKFNSNCSVPHLMISTKPAKANSQFHPCYVRKQTKLIKTLCQNIDIVLVLRRQSTHTRVNVPTAKEKLSNRSGLGGLTQGAVRVSRRLLPLSI